MNTSKTLAQQLMEQIAPSEELPRLETVLEGLELSNPAHVRTAISRVTRVVADYASAYWIFRRHGIEAAQASGGRFLDIEDKLDNLFNGELPGIDGQEILKKAISQKARIVYAKEAAHFLPFDFEVLKENLEDMKRLSIIKSFEPEDGDDGVEIAGRKFAPTTDATAEILEELAVKWRAIERSGEKEFDYLYRNMLAGVKKTGKLIYPGDFFAGREGTLVFNAVGYVPHESISSGQPQVGIAVEFDGTKLVLVDAVSVGGADMESTLTKMIQVRVSIPATTIKNRGERIESRGTDRAIFGLMLELKKLIGCGLRETAIRARERYDAMEFSQGTIHPADWYAGATGETVISFTRGWKKDNGTVVPVSIRIGRAEEGRGKQITLVGIRLSGEFPELEAMVGMEGYPGKQFRDVPQPLASMLRAGRSRYGASLSDERASVAAYKKAEEEAIKDEVSTEVELMETKPFDFEGGIVAEENINS